MPETHDQTPATPSELAHGLDRAIQYLMVALLTFTPLAIGGIDTWAQEVALLIVAVMSVALLVKLTIQPSARLVGTWALLPLGFFIALTLLQLLPLPSHALAALSPGTLKLRSEALAGLPGQADQPATLSFYPWATVQQLRLAIAVAAVFVIVIHTYRSERRIARLLATVSIIGAGVAIVQLLHVFSGTQKLFGAVLLLSPQSTRGGTFASYNSFAQFMNLSIAAMLAYFFISQTRDLYGKARLDAAWLKEPLAENWRKWLPLAGVLVAMAAICVSGSRGGIISMAVAGAATAVILIASGRLRGLAWGLAVSVCGALLCLLYMGFDHFWERMATLGDFGNAYALRAAILHDTLNAWRQFPIFGGGLGSHEMLYPSFSTSELNVIVSHAENEYAQMAEEVGALGLLAIAAFAAIVLKNWFASIRQPYPRVRTAAFGLGFGLLAVSIHSFSDFGLHKPANAFLAAAFCALLTVMATSREEASRAPIAVHPIRRRVFCLAALAVVLAVSAWALIGLDAARRAAAASSTAQLIMKAINRQSDPAPNSHYAALIDNAQRACSLDPSNVEYRFRLDNYRWRSISRTNSGGSAIVPVSSLPYVSRIVDDLDSTRLLCPVYGPVASQAGRLKLCVLGQTDGIELIRLGRRLDPQDPTANLAVGTLDAIDGRRDLAAAEISKAIRLDGTVFSDAVQFCLTKLNDPPLAVELAGDDPGRLCHVVKALRQRQDCVELAATTSAKAVDRLKQTCKVGAPAWQFAALGEYYLSAKDFDQARLCYTQALHLEYDNVSWRLCLAQSLAALGRTDDASDQVNICLSQSPNNPAAQRFLSRLANQRAGIAAGG